MRLSSLFAPGLAALFLSAADAPLALPQDAVVLVVAGWCAPCRGEIAQLAAIVAAAGPHEVRVAALDDQPSTRAMLAAVPAAHRWRLTVADRVRLGALVFARSAGLPYAFATDARGARCADFSGGLDAPRTRMLIARCGP